MTVTTSGSDVPDRNVHGKGAASQRKAVETPFRHDADRDFEGAREDSHYMTSTSGARDDIEDHADW